MKKTIFTTKGDKFTIIENLSPRQEKKYLISKDIHIVNTAHYIENGTILKIEYEEYKYDYIEICDISYNCITQSISGHFIKVIYDERGMGE